MKTAGLVVAVAVALLVPTGAQAQQQYCAFYSDGTQSCGIPTLQSCEDSVRGVGGDCHVDDSAQIPPNFFQRWRDAQRANQKPSSPELDDVPPPPGLSLTPTGPVGPPPTMYCANFNNGTQTCGIASLRECEDTVRGVGGMCQSQ
jgi:hypothetical protein